MTYLHDFDEEGFKHAFRHNTVAKIAAYANASIFEVLAKAARLDLIGEAGPNQEYWEVKTEAPEAPVKQYPEILEAEIVGLQESSTQGDIDVEIKDTLTPENKVQEKVSNEPSKAEGDTMTLENAVADTGQENHRWTDDMLKELLFMNRNGFSNKDMAFKLKKSENAIKQKLKVLGVYKPDEKGSIVDDEELASSIQVDDEDELVAFMDENQTSLNEDSAFREMLRRRLILDNYDWELVKRRLLHPETYLKHSKQTFNLLGNPKLQSPMR